MCTDWVWLKESLRTRDALLFLQLITLSCVYCLSVSGSPHQIGFQCFQGAWLLNRASHFNCIFIWKNSNWFYWGENCLGLEKGMVDSSWPLPMGLSKSHWPCAVSFYAFFWPWCEMQLHCMFPYSWPQSSVTSLFKLHCVKGDSFLNLNVFYMYYRLFIFSALSVFLCRGKKDMVRYR